MTQATSPGEVADLFFTGVGGLSQARCVGKRVGNREFAILEDVLAGLQVPPEIGVGDFRAKDPQQENAADSREGNSPSA